MSDPLGPLIAYLADQLAPVWVSSDVPPAEVPDDASYTRPVEFVQVRQVSGRSDAPVKRFVGFDVWVWATGGVRAADLMDQVVTAVWELAGRDTAGFTCYGLTETMSPRQADDPETGTPRQWATWEFSVRDNRVMHRAPATTTP